MIQWLPWGADAFARARGEGKPVLLSITAAWCRACHEMDRTTYADPDVAAIICDRFVPVRVDTDRRPDINERYNLGGWPTTAFLTADGGLLTGTTFVPADRMSGILTRVADAFHARRSDMNDAAPAARDLAEASASAFGFGETGSEAEHDLDAVIESIFASYDDEHGGFGLEPKFPLTAPLHLSIALYRDTSADRWRRVVEHTLDAMADGGLWDGSADGGFYRYATTRDWRFPHEEKLLETNAALLRVYAEAALVFDRQVDRDRCQALARFITSVLRAESGGFHGSDADGTLYADANAAAAGALLGAATVLDDSALGQEALASFERVIMLCYKPGLGVAHYFDGSARVRGLLDDQVSAIAALLDAYDVSEGEPYRMMAEELGLFIVRDMWDAAHGGFFDRAQTPDDIGLLRTRRKPFVANADAAVALARLSRLEARKGFPDPAAFREHALGALRASALQLDGQGPLAAHYVLAQRQLL
jgi:uncharacterized protein YyaL (SSP411 family)